MTRANLQLTDYLAVGSPRVEDLAKLSAPLSPLLTMELDGATAALGLTADEILIAALGRSIERTIGAGSITLEVPRHGTKAHTMTLQCASPTEVGADELLAGVHGALRAMKIHRIVRGVPDEPQVRPVSQVLFAGVEAAATWPHLGHLLELRAYRGRAVLELDWWFDTRSFAPYTVQELAEQFPLALIELSSEAAPPIPATPELALAH
jgi:hypothetical protein